MNPSEFLDFSKGLDTTIESGARSCVSRSYYCAYHETKQYIEEILNVDTNRLEGGSHERISKILIQEKNQKLKGVGYKMITFHARRVMADYHLNIECTQEAANEAIGECEKILKILKDLNP